MPTPLKSPDFTVSQQLPFVLEFLFDGLSTLSVWASMQNDLIFYSDKNTEDK